MLTIRQTIRASAIIDKMGLEIKNPKATQEEIGADMLIQVASKLRRAEDEVYAFVAEIKKCTIEEAAETDIIQFIKDTMNDAGIISFFKSAVKSNVQG